MKRACQILTHKGMINSEPACGRQAACVTYKNKERHMKTIKLLMIFLFVATTSHAQKSPRVQTEGKISDITIHIDYGAPSVKGRTIWGEMEKYDTVWRAGANENTIITFDKNANINGKNLPAGKYGFFMIPKENGNWTVIFNKKNDAWGAFSYKAKEDALRAEIKPEYENKVQEQLNYSIEDNHIVFSWDKARISIPIK